MNCDRGRCFSCSCCSTCARDVCTIVLLTALGAVFLLASGTYFCVYFSLAPRPEWCLIFGGVFLALSLWVALVLAVRYVGCCKYCRVCTCSLSD